MHLLYRSASARAAALAVCLATTASGDALSVVKPETVGLSAKRLERLTAMLKADVEKGRIPGAVMLIERRGKLAYFETFGMRDKAKAAPMTKDAIFRIYSMTKPFTSVAAMMLAEEGKFRLNDPVAKLLPALAGLKVGIEKPGPEGGAPTVEQVAATRQPTVQDLLRHTSGFTYGVFGRGAVKTLYNQARVGSGEDTNEQLVEKLGKLPLMFQPGTTWEYSHSTDVLGRLVEVASGMSLDQFFQERIFTPLAMKDSGFSVPAEKIERLAQTGPHPETGAVERVLDVTKPPKYHSGGGGGVSTTLDYLRFCKMMLNGGELDGVRLLGRKTVELMTSDHLGPINGPSFLPGAGYGFGLGFAVRTEPGGPASPGSVGEYYWGGFAGTYFWIDPKEKLIAIFMIQAPSQQAYYPSLLKMLVDQAVVD